GEDNGDDRRHLICRDDGGPRRDNDINLEPDELGGERGVMLATPLSPAILDSDRAALGPAEFAQALHERSGPLALGSRRVEAEKPDARQLRLLRARRRWPRKCRAAEQRDELAASYLEHGLPLRTPRETRCQSLPHAQGAAEAPASFGVGLNRSEVTPRSCSLKM